MKISFMQSWDYSVPHTGTEYHMNMSGNTMIFSIKGSDKFSDSWLDWAINLMQWPTFHRDALGVFSTPAGFYMKWKSIMKKVKQFVEKNNPKNVIISGYSQGACAMYAHRFFKANYPQIKRSTAVWGCPGMWGLVGRKNSLRAVSDVINIRHGNDLFTKPLLGYVAGGKIKQFGEKRKWCKLSIKDHFIENYLKENPLCLPD